MMNKTNKDVSRSQGAHNMKLSSINVLNKNQMNDRIRKCRTKLNSFQLPSNLDNLIHEVNQKVTNSTIENNAKDKKEESQVHVNINAWYDHDKENHQTLNIQKSR